MKRTIFALICGLMAFAQSGTMTVTIPADVAKAYTDAHAAEYQQLKQRASRLAHEITEQSDPSAPGAHMAAEIATVICDKVLKYAPQDAPPRNAGESDANYRNRYQQQIRSKISVNPR